MEITQDLNKPVDDNSLDTIEMKEAQEQHPANPEPLPRPEAPEPQQPCDNTPTENCRKGHCHTCLTILNILLLIGLVVLYILHFTGTGTPSKVNPNASMPVIPEDGQLKVACVDSDTLLAKYQYAIDMEQELLAYKDQQEAYGRQQMEKFQNDYQDYLKNGANMTLSQQQQKEAELKQRAEKMSTLEQELSAKIMERQMSENTKLLNAIFAYVREYNAANQQFDIILRKTFNDSPTLYLNPAMDITDEIVNGLNEEYKEVKGK